MSQPPDDHPGRFDPSYRPTGSGEPAAHSGDPYGQWRPAAGQQPPPGYGQQGFPPRAPASVPLSASDERLWSTLAHLSIPFLGFVGPLIVYLVFKGRSPWLKANVVEALNFSILYTVAQFACSILSTIGIGLILLPMVFVGGIVLCVLAAVATNKGESYKYPVNWRLVK